MFCQQCGQKIADGSAFCENCGAKIDRSGANVPPVSREPVRQTPQQPVQPIVIQQREITEDQLPERLRPLSPWAYFGYNLLFAIPIVGFILLIVFSCSSANINRRNYARSFWCVLVLVAIAAIIVLIIAAATGGLYTLSRRW